MPRKMSVALDKAGNCELAVKIDDLCAATSKLADLHLGANSQYPAVFHSYGAGFRDILIQRDDFSVSHHEVGNLRIF